MLHQLVIRRRKRGILLSVLSQIDFLLLLLNPRPHGKGFGLHRNAQFLQHPEGVPGAVANGENAVVARNFLPRICHHAPKHTVFQLQPLHPGLKAHLTPQLLNPFPQILHHRQQHIGAHMGLGVVENVLPGSRLHKLLQNPADSRVVHPSVQFPIREGSRAALAKLHIAFWV